MTAWQIEPLGAWTRPVTKTRRGSHTFKAKWPDTLELLIREAGELGLRGAIAVRIDVTEGDLRRDGMLRVGAKVGFPGVVVSFESRHGPVSFATDAYEQYYGWALPAWQANLRAVALSLQALRAVDRYGVTKSGEQYVGWRALPAGGESMPAARAALIIRIAAGEGGETADGPINDRMLRRARANSHPDRNGGDRDEWNAVEQAVAVLGLDGATHA